MCGNRFAVNREQDYFAFGRSEFECDEGAGKCDEKEELGNVPMCEYANENKGTRILMILMINTELN